MDMPKSLRVEGGWCIIFIIIIIISLQNWESVWATKSKKWMVQI